MLTLQRDPLRPQPEIQLLVSCSDGSGSGCHLTKSARLEMHEKEKKVFSVYMKEKSQIINLSFYRSFVWMDRCPQRENVLMGESSIHHICATDGKMSPIVT